MNTHLFIGEGIENSSNNKPNTHQRIVCPLQVRQRSICLTGQNDYPQGDRMKALRFLLLIMVICILMNTAQSGQANEATQWRSETGALLTLQRKTDYNSSITDGASWYEFGFSRPAFRWGPGILYDLNQWHLRFKALMRSSTFEMTTQVILEPVALLHLDAGLGIGTGWNSGLGDHSSIGMGINPADDTKDIQELEPFSSQIVRAWLASRIILSAEFLTLDPWQRLVLELEPRIEYQSLSAAKPLQAWVWNNDTGMNFNGYQFSQSVLLGYRAPVIYGFREVGLGLQMKSWLFDVRESSPAASGWGSDQWTTQMDIRCRYVFSAWSSLFVQAYWKNYLHWTSDSVQQHRYFGFRKYQDMGGMTAGGTIAYVYSF
jgi:hypothetical protein